jgi:broad specificity phosphatase PhoE
MRTIEHRRHAPREMRGDRLSPAGREMARRLGGSLRTYDRVVTSPKARAVETAELLGYRVSATLPGLGDVPDDAGVPLAEHRPRTFADFAALFEQSSAMQTFAREQARLWQHELEKVPENGFLLMISHSGIIESGAVAALPDAARAWGEPLSYLEGVSLVWDGKKWVSGEVLRVSESGAPKPGRYGAEQPPDPEPPTRPRH